MFTTRLHTDVCVYVCSMIFVFWQIDYAYNIDLPTTQQTSDYNCVKGHWDVN